jgi:hypothetical protein
VDEYKEQPSSEQFEQQPGEYEEGKYNMNILSLLNTISFCILILYAYKEFLATLYPLYISFGLHFWLVVLGCCAITYLGPF